MKIFGENFGEDVQKFGKSLLFPISLLSFMAIFLGLSAALQNKEVIRVLPFLSIDVIQNILTLIRKLAGLPFGYLPLLFVMAIPMGMVKKDKDVAIYATVVTYIAFLLTQTVLLGFSGITADTTSIKALVASGLSDVDAALQSARYTSFLGVFTYNTNVIGAIFCAMFAIAIHNRFRQTELHPSLSFYSGKKFVPIISSLLMIPATAIFILLWPMLDRTIIFFGSQISKLGVSGYFVYGFLEKLINPTGLHHILNQVFRFTALGGVEEINGTITIGALNIYLAQLAAGLPFSPNATGYLAGGKILQMVFGLPAAVLAIMHVAKKANHKKVLNYYFAGISAVILTGITEPIEFTFIFISPLLWIANAILSGLCFLVPAILKVTIGNIQGGIIDWFVFGALQGMQTKWYLYFILGPIFSLLYYFTFKFIILHTNVPTIGRNDSDFSDSDEETTTASKVDLKEEEKILGSMLVEGLGGKANITDVDNCISRLRLQVADGSLVNEEKLKETKPNGIIRPTTTTVHIVFGGRVTKMRNILDNYLDSLK